MVERIGGENFYKRALDIFLEEYTKALKLKNRFSVALPGGETPKKLYELLVKEKLDWSKIDVFIVDERDLSLDHEDSNYNNIYNNLISKVDIPKVNFKHVRRFETLENSRLEYEYIVKKYFAENTEGFDLIILGMGKDGHIASIFPDNLELDSIVVPSLESSFHKYNRVSLGIKAINLCRRKLILLGKNKKDVINRIADPTSSVFYLRGEIVLLLED